MNKDDAGWGELLKSLRYLNLGVVMAIAITLWALAGNWVDGKIGTSPLLLIAGVFIGLFTGGLYCYRVLAKELSKPSEEDKETGRGGEGET